MITYPPAFDHSYVLLVRSQAIATDLDSYLSRIDPDEARLVTSYIFQISPGLREELSRSQSDHVHADLLARTSDRNLFTLTYISDRHELCRITTTGLELLESEEMENALRLVCKTELHRLVTKASDRCFYQATSRYHFIAPSGRHCRIFFRMGDIITSHDALERLAFWILPAVANAGAILVDNWSVASVALRALQSQRLDIPFDCLSYHPHQNRRDADVVIGDLIQSLPSGKPLLCLISVASSGRYTEVVRQIAREFNFQDDRVRFLGLYRFHTETLLDALCDLDESPDNYLPADCAFCHAGSKAVALHPELYYWKEFPEKPVVLQKRHFSSRQLNPYFPAFQIFGVRNLRNYSEGLLRGILLRAVLPGEWSKTIEVAELEQHLVEAARVQDQDIILGEIIIAAVRGSIDKSVVSAIEEVRRKHLRSDGYLLLERALLIV